MSIPERPAKLYEKDQFERALDDVITATQKNGTIAQSDVNKLAVAAQIQEGIDRYRAGASSMSVQALQEEEHNSARLGRHLEEKDKKRPPRCHAHALVAGKHEYAAVVRVLMAYLKIRIDDADNGCWLPENTAATPHPSFSKCATSQSYSPI